MPLSEKDLADLEQFLTYSNTRTPYSHVLGGAGRDGMLRRRHEGMTGEPIPPGQEGTALQGPPTPAGLGMNALPDIQTQPVQQPSVGGTFTPSDNGMQDSLPQNLYLSQQADASGQVEGSAGPVEDQGPIGLGNYDPAKAIQSEHYYEGLDNSRLEGTLDRQRYDVEQMTGEEAPDTDDEGMLTKILDNLMRPNYAVAGGFRALQEKDKDKEEESTVDAEDLSMSQKIMEMVPALQVASDLPEFLGGMRDGFTLQKKETFSDVLGAAGVENKVAKGLGGFVLDVALDPTTYIGGGLVKAATKSSAEAAGMKAATAAAQSPDAIKAAEQVVDNQVSRQLLDRLGPGGKKSADEFKPPTQKQRDAMVKKELNTHAADVGKAAQAAAETAGKVELKFGGKTIAQSEALYKGFSKLSKPVRELPTVRFFYSKLSPKGELGDMWQIMRDRENISIGSYFDHLREFRDLTKGTTPEMRKAVTHGIEGTKPLTDPEAIKLADHVKGMFDEMWEAEVAIGLHGKNPVKRANYVPIVSSKGSRQALEAVDAWKAGYHKGAPGFTKQRNNPTIEAGQKAGLDLREDIADIVSDRVAKHFQEMTHHSVMMDGIFNYGIRVPSKGAKNVVSGANKKVMDKAKELGVDFVPFKYKVVKGSDEVVHEALFPEPIARNLELIDRMHKDPQLAGRVLHGIDKIHQKNKFWLTVANPGHHIRNLYGNIFQAYEDGVTNPNHYRNAYKAVLGMNGKQGGKHHTIAQGTKVRIANGTSDLDEVADLYLGSGAKSGFYDSEFQADRLSKAGAVIRKVSTAREDTARMAHFIHALKEEAKEKGVDWTKMSKGDKTEFAYGAARRVRKFQLDYGDLTYAEQNINRRLMMFYTFARKNTMLQLEMLALRPGKLARIPQANNAIETMLGIEQNASGDFRFDDRVPGWVRDANAPQIGGAGNIISRMFGRDDHGDVTDDPIYGSPLLPTSDLNRLQGPAGTFRDIISELRPELRMPIEMAFGQRAFSGAPLPGAGDTIAQATPITNLLKKTYDAAGDPTQSVADDWTSYLSGVSVQRVNPQRQAGELRRRQQIVQEVLRKARTEYNDERLDQMRTSYETGNR